MEDGLLFKLSNQIPLSIKGSFPNREWKSEKRSGRSIAEDATPAMREWKWSNGCNSERKTDFFFSDTINKRWMD
jgi:hypothetical protein